MEVVTLTNGCEESAPLVAVVRLGLSKLLSGERGLNGILAVYEVAKLARDPEHHIFSRVQFDLLRDLQWVEGTELQPVMNSSVRNIIACAIEFHGEEPCLVDPRVV